MYRAIAIVLQICCFQYLSSSYTLHPILYLSQMFPEEGKRSAGFS